MISVTKVSSIFIFAALLFASVSASGHKGECEKCRKSHQCYTGKCWNGKCVWKHDKETSKAKCFVPYGGHCSRKKDCITEYCDDHTHKCAEKPHHHIPQPPHIPHIPTKLPECSKCKDDHECESHKCWGFKCVFDTQQSKEKCFKGTCDTCRNKRDCLSFNCKKGFCVTNSIRCVGAGHCEYCRKSKDCKEGECFKNQCVGKDRTSCGLKANCEYCDYDHQCKSGKCKYYQCASLSHGLRSCY